MTTNTNLDLDVKKGVNFLKTPRKTRSNRTKKKNDTEETARLANDVPSDFLRIIEDNLEDKSNGVAGYYRTCVEPLLKWVTANVGVPTPSGDFDDSDQSDAERARSSVAGAYSPGKTLEPTPVAEAKMASPGSGIQDHSTGKKFLQVLEKVFGFHYYSVMTKRPIELKIWFEDQHLQHLIKA